MESSVFMHYFTSNSLRFKTLTSILEWILKPNSLAVSRSNNYPKVDAELTHTLITLAFLFCYSIHRFSFSVYELIYGYHLLLCLIYHSCIRGVLH